MEGDSIRQRALLRVQIFFGYNDATLTAADAHALDIVASRARSHSHDGVIVRSGADMREDYSLAETRGEVARDYLLEHGVPGKRIRLNVSEPDTSGTDEHVWQTHRIVEVSISSGIYSTEHMPLRGEEKPMVLARVARLPITPVNVSVFYGTTRKAKADGRYSDARNALTYGIATIQINAHRLAGHPGPWQQVAAQIRVDGDGFRLVSIEPVKQQQFLTRLQDGLAVSTRREMLLFIHGFNNDFTDAATRTAQLAYDLGIDGAPVLFTWPAQRSSIPLPRDYTRDETNAEWSTPDLEQFIELVVGQVGANHIYVVAHSMGAKILLSALVSVAARHNGVIFDELVLAAPDIDAETFTKTFENVGHLAQRTTLYTSNGDHALGMSEFVHQYPRAGRSHPHARSSLSVVDIHGLDTSYLGHSYISTVDDVVDDLCAVVGGAQPLARKLRPMVGGGYELDETLSVDVHAPTAHCYNR
jgi:esterase/lipase superfamily enzyme